MLWGKNRGKWKSWQSPGVELRTPLAWAASALPLSHNSRTTTNLHNPLCVLYNLHNPYFHNNSWPLPHDYHESTPDYQWEHWPAAIACYAVSKTKPGNCGMHWHQKFLHVSISKSPGNFYNACPLDYDLSINNDAKRDHSSQGSIASTESQSDPGVLPPILSFSSCKGQRLQSLS